jgi:hypothetical protein
MFEIHFCFHQVIATHPALAECSLISQRRSQGPSADGVHKSGVTLFVTKDRIYSK